MLGPGSLGRGVEQARPPSVGRARRTDATHLIGATNSPINAVGYLPLTAVVATNSRCRTSATVTPPRTRRSVSPSPLTGETPTTGRARQAAVSVTTFTDSWPSWDQ
jgi:hypothetical protein